MNRRTLLKSSAGALFSGLAVAPCAALGNESSRHLVRKPKRLFAGDTVALVAPASNTTQDEDIRFAGDLIRSLGFSVREGKNLYARDQYLAGSDEDRAEDINRMFADDTVDALFCIRGGYGTPRILPLLNYDLIRANPKVLLGSSDITALLMAIYTQTGLVGFHGPNAGQNLTDYALAEFRKVIMEPSTPAIIAAPPPFESRSGYLDKRNRITRVAGGKARGRLVGGNLSLISTLIGTPFAPEFDNCILFLEDVNEEPYRIDRMLTHLWLAGVLEQVAGIAFGKFTKAESSGNSFSVEEVVRRRCEPLGIPVLLGLMIGHIADKTVVPIGIEAELDADKGSLTLLDTAVT